MSARLPRKAMEPQDPANDGSSPRTGHSFGPSAWCAVLPCGQAFLLECRCEYLDDALPHFRAWCRLNSDSEGYGTGLTVQEAEAEAAWDWCRRRPGGASLRYTAGEAPPRDAVVAHGQTTDVETDEDCDAAL